MSKIIWIENAEHLQDIVDISNITKVGVDLESNSMYKYYQKVCLLQLSIDTKIVLLDIPKIGLPKQIIKLFNDSRIVKIFQDMKYDLALLDNQFQCKLSNKFDITVADRLIRGERENRSLDKLVRDYLKCEINVSKSIQKSNWGKRPLSERQKQYAANDVNYLIPIMDKQILILKEDYRLACFKQYMRFPQPFNNLQRKSIDRYNINSMWKIKNIGRLDQGGLNRLRRLLLERNNYAKKIDVPVHWICNDNLLARIASKNPKNNSDFRTIFEKNRKLRNYQIMSIETLWKEMHNTSNDIILTEPPVGITRKKWVNKSKNEIDKISQVRNPKLSKKIKSWQSICAKTTKLLPEFLLDKMTRNELSISTLNSMKDRVTFPGIIDNFNDLFIIDLIQYIKEERTSLSSSKLLKVFHNKNHLP